MKCVWKRVMNVFKHRKFLFTIILSIVVVWLIPMSMLLQSNASVLLSARENAVENNRAVLTNFSDILDEKLRYVRSVIMQVSSDNKIQQLLLKSDPLTGEDRYNIKQIINENSVYFLSDSWISEIYIYLQRPGLIITSSTVYQVGLFDKTVSAFDGMPASQWFEGCCTGDMLYDDIHVVNVGGQDRIFCVQSLPLSYGSSLKGLIAVRLDEALLSVLAASSDWLYETYLVSPGGQILYTTDSELAFAQGVLAAPLGDSTLNLDGKEYTLIRLDVDHYDISCIAVVAMPQYLKQVISVQRNLTLQLILCVALSVALIAVLTQRSYKPICRIMTHASRVAVPKDDATVSEVEYISSSFDRAMLRQEELEQVLSDTVQDNEQMNRALLENAGAMRDNLRQLLVTGNADRYECLGDIMSHFEIDLPGDAFLSFVVQFSPAVPAAHPAPEEAAAALERAAAFLEERLFSESLHGVTAVTGTSTLTVLLNCTHGEQPDVEALTVDTNRDMVETLEADTPFLVNVGISSFVGSLTDVDISCQQAQAALDYGLMAVRPRRAVFRYRNICNSDKEYYYPIDTEKRIVDMMLSGDLRNVRRLLNSVYEENLTRRTLHPQMIRCFFIDVACTMMKVVGTLSVGLGYMDSSNQTILANVTNCRRTADFRYEVDRLIENVCTLVNRSRDDTGSRLKTRIVQCVEENYTRADMSQASVAEAMDISASYLSKYFKQEFRENMLVYVNRKRVDLAKQLLLTTDRLLDEIATQTGFGSSKTLIRVFKKYEGITPGMYRDLEKARHANDSGHHAS